MNGPRQFALGLDFPASFDAHDFVAGPANEAALALIGRWPDWPVPHLRLTGPAGAGKTHLARIWAARAGAPLARAPELCEADVPDLAAGRALAIDDAGVPGAHETALFHLLNLARERGLFVLCAARGGARGEGGVADLRLADLASRLRAMPAVALGAPDDALLRRVLAKLLADRQLAVEPVVLDYLGRRMERSFAAAIALAAALDRLALEERRPITRALAARALTETTPS